MIRLRLLYFGMTWRYYSVGVKWQWFNEKTPKIEKNRLLLDGLEANTGYTNHYLISYIRKQGKTNGLIEISNRVNGFILKKDPPQKKKKIKHINIETNNLMTTNRFPLFCKDYLLFVSRIKN